MIKNRVNIAIVENSQILCEGLSNLLSKSNHEYYIFRLRSIEELIKLSNETTPDIVIINIGIVQNRNQSFIKIKKQLPHLSWIGLQHSYYEEQLLSLFDSVYKISDSFQQLLHIIENLQSNFDNRENTGDELSERETDVLKCIATGLSNKESADKLNISIHTIISHRKNISEKTGIKSLAGLTIYAITHNIISLNETAY